VDQAHSLLPFVWAVDGNALLHRVLISRELILACRDRLNFWHSLQELAGVKNRYVELAIERTQNDERARFADEKAAMQAAHLAEIEAVRERAASEAMQRLTDTLLGLDLAGGALPMVAGARPARAETPAAAPESAETEPEVVEAAPEPEDDGLAFDEPWIDTPLCTSCNDCLRINPQLFLYNEDKQAYLGDKAVGTFAQLVEGAELCPAKCIHPGKPWDPSEPNLDELIERAAPFN
jgi:ferredoxin